VARRPAGSGRRQVQDDVDRTLDVLELLLAGVDSLVGANLGEEEVLGAAALGDLNGEVSDPARGVGDERALADPGHRRSRRAPARR
jgi:hypothetical protein